MQRLLSALLGIPVIIYLLYEGKYLFLLSLFFLTLVGLYELRRMFLRIRLRISPYLMYGCGLIFPLFAFFVSHDRQDSLFYLVFTLILLIHLTFLMISFPRYTVNELAASFLGCCYIGFLFSFLILIRKIDPYGFLYVLLVVVLTWACDIGAYLAGHFWGRHPLWQELSPHKTWEGSVGGLGLSIVTAFVFQQVTLIPISTPDALALGVIVGITAQVGDLVESVFKRLSGIKDSGYLIPGHGGILDRCDSLLFSVPVAYVYFRFLLLY